MTNPSEYYGLYDSPAKKEGGKFELGNPSSWMDVFKGGAKKGSKKAAAPYVKTGKTVTGRDGVARTVYTKGGKQYVKKKNAEGKFVYREVKRK